MKFTPLVFCTLLLLPIISFAEDITLNDGTELKDATVTRVEKDGMMIETADGVQKYSMSLIPKEVQLVHPYIPPSPPPTPTPSVTPPVVVEAGTPAPKAAPTEPSGATESPALQTVVHLGNSCEFFVKAGVAAFLVLFAALLTAWIIAKCLIGNLALRQKQREFDAANAQQFQTAYMDFFAIWKLWDHYLDHGENELPDHGEYEIPHASRWELLTRTYIAEGSVDAVFLKLTAARKLTPGAIELLGRFRQAFHTLGLAIKNNKPMNWKDPEHPDYLVFKRLASGVAALIDGENLGAQAADLRADAFRQVTSARWERSWSSESSHPST